MAYIFRRRIYLMENNNISLSRTRTNHLDGNICVLNEKNETRPSRWERDSRIYDNLMRIRIWEPRSRIKLFLSIELSGALSRLRLRNLSLSDGGFRLSSQATTARSSFSYCASAPVNRRTSNSSQRDRMQNIVLAHFPLIYLDAIPEDGSANSPGINPALTPRFFYIYRITNS